MRKRLELLLKYAESNDLDETEGVSPDIVILLEMCKKLSEQY